jgi:hypothetical protein
VSTLGLFELLLGVGEFFLQIGVFLLELAGVEEGLVEFAAPLGQFCLQGVDFGLIVFVFVLESRLDVHQGHIFRFLNLEEFLQHRQVAAHFSVLCGQSIDLVVLVLAEASVFFALDRHPFQQVVP